MRKKIYYLVRKCPYCGYIWENTKNSIEVPYGRKFYRFEKCNKIFFTGKFLFDDHTRKERMEKAGFSYIIHLLIIIIPIALYFIFPYNEIIQLSLFVTIIGFLYLFIDILRYIVSSQRTFDKTIFKEDEELYQLELKASELIKSGTPKEKAITDILNKIK